MLGPVGGKRHDMGLEPFPLVSLAEAREKADAARRERLEGKNPLEARRQEQREQRLKAATAITFQEPGSQYVAAHEAGWKNKKHRWQMAANT